MLFESAGIVARLDREEALELAKDVYRYLSSKRLKVLLDSELAQILAKPNLAVALNQMRTDFIITIGGDGTILKTCLTIPEPKTPIFAINMGRRGFLTEVTPEKALFFLKKCLKGEFTLKTYMKLSSQIGGKNLPDALNEILVASRSPSKMLRLRLSRNGLRMVECDVDGIIIATPTGSTAHSLSAGGAVLDPSLNAFIVTPICPLTPFYPIVFPSESLIRVDLLKPQLKGIVAVDGQYQQEILPQESISVKVSDHQASFIRFRESLYNSLKSRFLFLGEVKK